MIWNLNAWWTSNLIWNFAMPDVTNEFTRQGAIEQLLHPELRRSPGGKTRGCAWKFDRWIQCVTLVSKNHPLIVRCWGVNKRQGWSQKNSRDSDNSWPFTDTCPGSLVKGPHQSQNTKNSTFCQLPAPSSSGLRWPPAWTAPCASGPSKWHTAQNCDRSSASWLQMGTMRHFWYKYLEGFHKLFEEQLWEILCLNPFSTQ